MSRRTPLKNPGRSATDRPPRFPQSPTRPNLPFALNRSTWGAEVLLEGQARASPPVGTLTGKAVIEMIPTRNRKHWIISRRALAPLLGALLALSLTAEVRGIAEEDIPSGRLGYAWVPDPPKEPGSSSQELGLEIAKYGGGSLVALWVLRKMFGGE